LCFCLGFLGTVENNDMFINQDDYDNIMTRESIGSFIYDAIGLIWPSSVLLHRSWSGQKGPRAAEWITQQATTQRRQLLNGEFNC
jgi:hypothetical protein